MDFITLDDIKIKITTGILDRIIEADSASDTSLIDGAEREARIEVEGYLANRFDCAAIFAATGTDRNEKIVAIMVDLMLYNLYPRVVPDNIPEIRVKRYDDDIKWLAGVRDGIITVDLPILEVTDEDGNPIDSTFFGLGGNKKYSQQW